MLRLKVRARPFISAVTTLRVVGDSRRCVVTFEEEPAIRSIGNLVRPVLDPSTHVRNHRSLRRLADSRRRRNRSLIRRTVTSGRPGTTTGVDTPGDVVARVVTCGVHSGGERTAGGGRAGTPIWAAGRRARLRGPRRGGVPHVRRRSASVVRLRRQGCPAVLRDQRLPDHGDLDRRQAGRHRIATADDGCPPLVLRPAGTPHLPGVLRDASDRSRDRGAGHARAVRLERAVPLQLEDRTRRRMGHRHAHLVAGRRGAVLPRVAARRALRSPAAAAMGDRRDGGGGAPHRGRCSSGSRTCGRTGSGS